MEEEINIELINKYNNKTILLKEFLENKIVLNCKTIEDVKDLFSYVKNINKEEKENLVDCWYIYKDGTCYEYCSKNIFYKKQYYSSDTYYYMFKEQKEIKIWKK